LEFYRACFVAEIGHFYPTVFAGTGEPYYQSRQVSTDFFAGNDMILAGSGKFLPTAARNFKYLICFPFLYIKKEFHRGSYPRPAERAPLSAGEGGGVGNSHCEEQPPSSHASLL
jgi:hypothetical protein